MQSAPELTEDLDPAQVASGDPATPPASMPGLPGILTVVLHEAEGVGVSAPDRYKQRLNPRGITYNQPYALVEYEHCQVIMKSLWGTVEAPIWKSGCGTLKFDVSQFAELTIFLYLKDRATGRSERPQDVFVGAARVPLVDALCTTGPQWWDIEDGTGRISISVEYQPLGNKQLDISSDFEKLYYGQFKKHNTQQMYYAQHISAAEATSSASSRKIFGHPFTSHLMFSLAATDDGGQHLLTPSVDGGFLFRQLQRDKCFPLERACLYAAEMVCALEYLHDVHGIFGWLKPRNVLLDSVGHVVLCGFGLFNRALGKAHGAPEYPAPEVLRGESADSRTADWWTLGVFLLEMLTGLPPFYDNNHEEVRRQILDDSQPVSLPDSLSDASRDFIVRLLDRRPGERLGARGGAAEIKAHPFFDGVDWNKVLQRRYQPAFKPAHTRANYADNSPFTQYGATEPPPYRSPTLFKFYGPAPPIMAKPTPDKSVQAQVIKEEDGRKLAWEAVPGAFHIYDPVTKTRELILPRFVPEWAVRGAGQTAATNEVGAQDDTTDSTVPSQNQKHDIVAAAMQAGYTGVIRQVLEEHGGTDLNVDIYLGTPPNRKETSPLEWATEQENESLVRLLLAHGADANYPGANIVLEGRPALIKAVETGNQTLAALLLPNTARLASTRALGLAIDRQDAAMAALLLSEKVQTDFEADDRPEPRHPDDTWQYSVEPGEPAEEFIPPLVRAIKHRDAGLVQLLLAHGADPNVGYHDLTVRDPGPPPAFEQDEDGRWTWPAPVRRAEDEFRCGRAVELAAAMGLDGVVRLLLGAGADVHRAHPVWNTKGHEGWGKCARVPRDVHQWVVKGLRDAVRAYEESEVGGGEVVGDAALST